METSRDDFVIAIRSAFLKKGTQQRFSLLALIFFSIVFLILSSLNFKAIDYVKISIKEIVYRSSFIISGPENFIKYSFNKFRDHYSHYNEYQSIKNKLNDLQSKDLSKKIITLENIKLKKLIDDYFIKDEEVFAKVLIDKNSPFLRSVVINKGSKNNIKLGMVVLDEMYLVGKIIEVNYSTSRVLLLSDINSKIPVSLEPGGIQAIMSGTGSQMGTLQYTKDSYLENIEGDILVFTSGAGGLFKSGIPVGKISEANISSEERKTIDFYVDFSQLKYIKVLSFSKEQPFLSEETKEEIEKIENQTIEIDKDKETLKILLEQKKIADEIRSKIEEENELLKSQVIKLQNEILTSNKIIKNDEERKKEIQFIEMNIIYGKKCKKTFFNNRYVEGSNNYRNCVLNKGKLNN